MNKKLTSKAGKTGLLYKKEYVKQAFEELSAGKSTYEVVAGMGVTKETFANWRRLFPELDEAVILGREAGLAYWIGVGRDNMENPTFSWSAHNTYLARVYGVGMKKSKRIDLRSEKMSDSYKKLLEIMSSGIIDSKESVDLSKMLLNGAALIEHTELSEKIKHLEAKLDEAE